MARIGAVVALILLASLTQATAADRQTLRFAPLPLEFAEAVIMQVMPMLDWLQERTGHRFEVTYTPSYTDLIQRFVDGEIDLAYLGPLPYLRLRESFRDADPVLHFLEADGRAFYTCSVFGSLASGAQGPAHEGPRVALTQPLSTCGYLMTDLLLREDGNSLERSRYRFLGSHDEAVLAVARGEADLAGARTTIGQRFRHLGLRILRESEPVPSFSLVVNRGTVDENTIERLVGALTALSPLDDPDDAAVTASWGTAFRYGAIRGSDQSFDLLRDRVSMGGIPMEDNW